MIAIVDAWPAEMGAWQKEMSACQETMKACPESQEPTSVEVQSELEHPEVPKEEEAVKSSAALKKRHGDWHLAVRRHKKPKKRTQGNGGSSKKVAATCRGMNRHAIPAPSKGHGRQGQSKDKAVQGNSKGQTFRKRRRPRPECNNGIRDRGLRQQLQLKSKRAFKKTIRQIF
jgi:hypothetical protein